MIIIVLVSSSSFGLGALSKQSKTEQLVQIEDVFPSILVDVNAPANANSSIPEMTNTTLGLYVGSKNSDKYHYPWCSGALRIKEENKVWFVSREDAESRGYTPAANCKGL